jgi:hypothetical protein
MVSVSPSSCRINIKFPKNNRGVARTSYAKKEYKYIHTTHYINVSLLSLLHQFGFTLRFSIIFFFWSEFVNPTSFFPLCRVPSQRFSRRSHSEEPERRSSLHGGERKFDAAAVKKQQSNRYSTFRKNELEIRTMFSICFIFPTLKLKRAVCCAALKIEKRIKKWIRIWLSSILALDSAWALRFLNGFTIFQRF